MNLRLIIPHSRVLCYDCFGIAAKREGSVRLRPDPPAMKGILGAGRIIAAGIPGRGIPVPRPGDPSKKVSVLSAGLNRYREKRLKKQADYTTGFFTSPSGGCIMTS